MHQFVDRLRHRLRHWLVSNSGVRGKYCSSYQKGSNLSSADEAYDLLDRRPEEAVQVMLTH